MMVFAGVFTCLTKSMASHIKQKEHGKDKNVWWFNGEEDDEGGSRIMADWIQPQAKEKWFLMDFLVHILKYKRSTIAVAVREKGKEIGRGWRLLFVLVFAEAMVAFLLMVKIGPLRELVMNGLDQVRMRKGIVLTIDGTMSVILFSNWVSLVKIQNKGAKIGTMTPTDQVLWRTHLLEASLMGTCLPFRSTIVVASGGGRPPLFYSLSHIGDTDFFHSSSNRNRIIG
ncbi:hypothetical protein L1987_59755 [Smallanthus sonchifolius]|uniref:Uncharacterized protein n=1 Tax=Smallanthus sonchifolius TaxID=185202 RepID=A0ACB9D6D5_9ASTR|nr:hypothetical protein L1987_59755 [Smallanthus sonchifolius]